MDLEQARQLAAMELYGDWYRDPWGWPEVLSPEFVADLDPEKDLGIDKRSISTSMVPFFHPLEVPKSYLGARPAVIQDPISRLAFNAATLSGVSKLHSDLPEWVYGWRLRDQVVAKNKPEWAAYVESLPPEDSDIFGLVTDVTSFFASVDSNRLLEIVSSAAGKTVPREVIAATLEQHAAPLGRSGLPQRSFASAILANCYLQPMDDALQTAASTSNDITGVRRWMDDISAEGSEEALYALHLELQDKSRQIGLELNSAKTHLHDAAQTGQDLRSETLKIIEVEFQRMKLSEYSTEEVDVAVDMDVLTDLESEIIENPDAFGRPVIRSVLHSLSKYAVFDRSAEWREIAYRIPHVADNLGRYFRDSMSSASSDTEARELASWFNWYTKSQWGRQNWVTSQFALAFDEGSSPRVEAVLREWLEYSDDLQQVAIAVERMSRIDPSFARNRMTARADSTSDPLLLRVFALGLLSAKAHRSTVAAVLERDKRNNLLSLFLAKRHWEPPHVTDDFSGSEDDADMGAGPNV